MLAAHQVRFFESPALTLGVCLVAVVGGLFAGSILHTMAWRMSKDRPALGGGRHCASCDHPLTFRESLPLLGWLLQRGICPYCGEHISLEGPLCEMLCSGMFVSVVLRYGATAQTLEVLGIVCVLFLIALSALKEYRIPNGCILMAYLIRIAYLAWLFVIGDNATQLVISSITGALGMAIPLALALFLSDAMLDRDITGMGTVKLASVMGFYLGWQQGILAMAAAVMLLAVVWLLSPVKLQHVEVEGGAHRDPDAAGTRPSPRDLKATLEEDIAEPMRVVPFAPAIAIAFWVVLLVGITPGAWNAPIF